MWKTTTLFLSSSLLISAVQAQITLNSVDMPNAGDSIKLSVTNSIGSADATLTGPNYVWDFSTLTPNNQRFDKYDFPSTFPFPYNLIFNPSNTSYGKNNYQNTGTTPAGTIDEAYDFFKETTVNLRQVGAAYTINGTPIPFMYSKFDTIYRFPMNYTNTDSCDYKYGLSVPTFGYYGQKGHRVNVIDGWGTITTPFGTFSALRVKSTVRSIDTVYYASLSIGSNLPARTRNEYKWLTTGMKIPVLEIDANVTGGTETIFNVMYIDSLRTGVPQVGINEYTTASDLAVFPNPAADQLNLQFTMATAAKVRINISNTIGQTIAVIAEGNFSSGKQNIVVNVKELGLKQGIYFVLFESNGAREVKKVVVSK